MIDITHEAKLRVGFSFSVAIDDSIHKQFTKECCLTAFLRQAKEVIFSDDHADASEIVFTFNGKEFKLASSFLTLTINPIEGNNDTN